MDLFYLLAVSMLLVIGSSLPVVLFAIFWETFRDFFKVKIGDKEY